MASLALIWNRNGRQSFLFCESPVHQVANDVPQQLVDFLNPLGIGRGCFQGQVHHAGQGALPVAGETHGGGPHYRDDFQYLFQISLAKLAPSFPKKRPRSFIERWGLSGKGQGRSMPITGG